jgi:hypothetical protein
MVRGLCSNNISSEKGEIVVYQPDEITRLEVRVDGEDVWLNRHQLSVLFGRDIKTIGKHIKNALAEELADMAVVANFATTATDGKTYVVQYYNLEMVLSVGYRVKSSKGVLFRQWANKVLRECLLKDCAINPRLMAIERRLDDHEKKIDFFVRTSLPPVEGVFHANQIYDAHILMTKFIKQAKNRIVVIDNYVDDSVLTLLSKRKVGVSAEIYTYKISEQFSLDLTRHHTQYPQVKVHVNKNCHDRFLIVDELVYHIGASIKDLGQKLCAVTLLNSISATEILSKLI